MGQYYPFFKAYDVRAKVPDELDAAVGTQAVVARLGVLAGQRIEDGRVEHEHAQHLPATAQRVVERRVVVRPQVAAEPHEALGVGLVDGQ